MSTVDDSNLFRLTVTSMQCAVLSCLTSSGLLCSVEGSFDTVLDPVTFACLSGW